MDQATFERIIFAPGKRAECSVTSRFFTGATRRVIEVRDRQCQHEFCDLPADKCQIDHIVPYSQGGLTEQENGQVLCGRHNRDALRAAPARRVGSGLPARIPLRPPRSPPASLIRTTARSRPSLPVTFIPRFILRNIPATTHHRATARSCARMCRAASRPLPTSYRCHRSLRGERAAVWLVRIGDPCASLGEFGHPFWSRLPLDTFEKPFIECRQ